MKSRRLVSLLLACTFLFCMFAVPAAAAEESVFFECDGHMCEMTFDEDTTPEMQQKIIDSMTGEESGEVEVQNVTCSLFGHKYTTEKKPMVTHKVYAAAPRCIKRIFNVKTCSRCGDVDTEVLSTTRIYCCS